MYGTFDAIKYTIHQKCGNPNIRMINNLMLKYNTYQCIHFLANRVNKCSVYSNYPKVITNSEKFILPVIYFLMDCGISLFELNSDNQSAFYRLANNLSSDSFYKLLTHLINNNIYQKQDCLKLHNSVCKVLLNKIIYSKQNEYIEILKMMSIVNNCNCYDLLLTKN